MRARHGLALTTAAVLVGTVFAGVSFAVSSGRTISGGLIHVYLIGSLASSKPPVVITGAFADAGTFTEGGEKLSTIALSKGSFKVNDSRGYAQETAVFGHLSKYVDAKTCAFNASYTEPSTLLGGTGAYAGISGRVTIANTLAGVFPTLKNGKCNLGQNARPIGFVALGQGTGTVSFK